MDSHSIFLLFSTAFNCAKNPPQSTSDKLLQKQTLLASDYVQDAYSPTQEGLQIPTSPYPPGTRLPVTIVLLTGEQRTLDVPNTWTSDQVLADLIGSPVEAKEYFLRCPQTGSVLFRNDLVANYTEHALVVTPKVSWSGGNRRGNDDDSICFTLHRFCSPSTWCATPMKHCLASALNRSWHRTTMIFECL